jgi:multidrug efflux pump subunit AcrA (membrane-fusion protein)
MAVNRRKLIIPIVIVLVVVGAIIANQGIDRKEKVDVTVDEVERGTLVSKVSGPGRVRAETTVQVSSSVMARIEELAVDEGDVIEQGQFLMRLDDIWYSSQVEQASARVERATAELTTVERELNDAESQYERDLISEKERDDFVARAVMYRKARQEARAALRAARISSTRPSSTPRSTVWSPDSTSRWARTSSPAR